MKINLDALYEFYDPHPGFAGAAIPIPKKVRMIANEIDGKKMTVAQAIEKIGSVTDGEVYARDQMILLKIKDGAYTHSFRVIRFK